MIEAGDPQGLILFGPHEFKKIDLVMNIFKKSIKCIIATWNCFPFEISEDLITLGFHSVVVENRVKKKNHGHDTTLDVVPFLPFFFVVKFLYLKLIMFRS